ncbi:MAG TPA: metallophosphoesterase [Pilimelia sp.]|nr:metallophosphoesterase [Pilimelia sp.]
MTPRAGSGIPGSAAGSFVLAHVSDLHVGAHLPEIAEALVADVEAVRPDLTVVTGDCTMRARPDQFRAARLLLDRLPAPRLVVLGNHDVPLFAAARLLSPYARYRVEIQPDLDPLVDLAGLRALGLQSMPRWRWKGGRVSRRQATFVAELPCAAPATSVRLVALHHPPFAIGPARIAGRAALLRALAAARVDLVLAGHTHVPRSRAVELGRAGGGTHRLIEVVAGTATSTRTRGAARSWTVIRVDRTAVAVEVRAERAGRWSTGHTARYPRDQGVSGGSGAVPLGR